MGKYNFDQIIERKGTSCLKYDFGKQRMGREDLLPLWVADMDFALPEEILQVIHERVNHGIFGYTDPDQAYFDVLHDWILNHYGWEIQQPWNTVTPGVVYSIATSIRALTQEGDAVLIQEPVYYPFRETIEDNNRVCVNNALVEVNGHYEVDWDDFTSKIQREDVKVFLLCSPHNPVGRVWTRQELEKMTQICLENDVKLIVDEIHCDFIFSHTKFTAVATLGEEVRQNAIFLTSASKTFNIAGFQVANVLIPNARIRGAFKRVNAANGYSQGNALGMTATKAVYELGDQWLKELVAYLEDNLAYMRNFLKERIPQARLIEPEGTYLIWVDFKEVTDDYKTLHDLMIDGAKLWLDDGAIFGEATKTFERFNIACPRAILEQAMEQLADAVDAFLENK